MGTSLIVCARDHAALRPLPENLSRFARRLSPMGIDHLSPEVHHERGALAAVIRPGVGAQRRGLATALGWLRDGNEDWHQIDALPPDGSYALMRADDHRVELVSDPAGSRSIWYAEQDGLFVASTSQRLAVMVLGGYRPNSAALAWMLSSGSLGPEPAWDRRLSLVPPDAVLTWDRDSWSASLAARPVVFVGAGLPPEEQRSDLYAAIDQALDSSRFDLSQWILPLSGGYDSRIILHRLAGDRRLRCVTWTDEAGLAAKDSDVAIARALAEGLRFEHRVHLLQDENLDPGAIAERFIAVGEGRIDHVSGYLDGFALWRDLAGSGVGGILRGDEGFGWQAVHSKKDVRYRTGLMRMQDWHNGVQLAEHLESQPEPVEWHHAEGQTLPGWRDLLYHSFRIPRILASLTSLKTPFLEVANPLLAREILSVIRSLDDDLRTDKNAYRSHVRNVEPRFGFATGESGTSRADLFGADPWRSWLRQTLERHEGGIVPAPVRTRAIEGLAHEKRAGIQSRIRRALPPGLRRNLRARMVSPRLEAQVLAWRIVISERIHELLEEDASLARESGPFPREADRPS